jgi:N-acetylmuramoyl-L-alanine amidase
VLEIRPSPPAGAGLIGLIVAIDAGHPPGGAIGPTGLTEDSLSLAVALEAAERLRGLGAKPILTRLDAAPVSLEARVLLAETAGAHLFVSVHVNAPGDGRPPESVDGTRVFWLRPHSQQLAKALEDSVAAALHQVRAGAIQSDLAVLRPTWFPSALVEGTTLVLPGREAYLRSPAGVADYAAGIIAGIRAWAEGPYRAAPTAAPSANLNRPNRSPQ